MAGGIDRFRRAGIATAIVAALLAAGGCGADEEDGGDGPSATLNISLGPISRAQNVQFEDVEVGESETTSIDITNDTGTPRSLTDVEVTGPDAPQFIITGGDCAEGVTLEPGDSCSVDVTFTPAQVGERTAILSVVPDEGGEQTAQLSGNTGTGTGTDTETATTETTETDTTTLPAPGPAPPPDTGTVEPAITTGG